MFCKNCGAENKDTARFCNDCGSLILRAAPSGNASPRQQPATAREPLVTRAPQARAATVPLAAPAPQTTARPQAKPEPKPEPLARPQPAAKPEAAASPRPSAASLPRRQPRVLTASVPETETRARVATPESMRKVEMPQAHAPKTDTPKAAAPKAEVSKAEVSKNEVPKPKVEAPKPRGEMPKPMAEIPKSAPQAQAPKVAVPPLQTSSTPVKRTPRKMEIFEPPSPPPEPPRAKPKSPEKVQRLETFTPAMVSSGEASITWPSVDTSPIRETGAQLFSGKPGKPTGRADAEKFTILIALAVVIIAVIAVSVGGYYLYMHDPAPPTPPNLQKLSKAQREPPSQQQPVEEVSMVIPPLALSAPATEEGDALQADPPAEIPDAPPAAGIVEPEIKAPPAADKATKPSARVQPVQTIPADDPVITTTTAPVRADENIKEKEEAKEDTKEEEPFSGYKVAFKVGFGQLAETRTYPSKQMRNRALELWTLEQKILEPDGTVNDKYVLKEAEFSPIPGH